jgi:DUF1680 family protein
VKLKQKTEYPWDGKVTLNLELERNDTFGVKLRIPDWCKNAKLSVNNQEIDMNDRVENGYIPIEREWKSGDTIELNLLMPVERIYSHPNVRQNTSDAAIQRGPIIYCLESADNVESLHKISLLKEGELTHSFDDSLLGGVVTIVGDAELIDDSGWDHKLYRTEKPKRKPYQLKAIPYYAWDNREHGQMRVWIQEGEK